ncbi:MAG: hypothetical protein E7I47_10595 [Clostridium sp.]|jgi:hypothetical protein|uniref:hypothetical protein n=1 Tax=Clostridium sp. TaxID=1506 RepID=UPI00204DB448|nr:hypothetical protein [Clostridium sp.]MDU4319746.1 hypothetical protein [Clostridium sp.]DAE86144.1 MAG TPA: hypothetical protein [Caudoviricetes sp.]DAK92428.1 MAG TPA: hypothetical protein [Bacteriophage sp.]
MPIDESLPLIFAIIKTHYEDRHHKEWLLSCLISNFNGDKACTYNEYIGINKSIETTKKTIDEIKAENEKILENFFK